MCVKKRNESPPRRRRSYRYPPPCSLRLLSTLHPPPFRCSSLGVVQVVHKGLDAVRPRAQLEQPAKDHVAVAVDAALDGTSGASQTSTEVCVCVCVKEHKENVAQRQCMRCVCVCVCVFVCVCAVVIVVMANGTRAYVRVDVCAGTGRRSSVGGGQACRRMSHHFPLCTCQAAVNSPERPYPHQPQPTTHALADPGTRTHRNTHCLCACFLVALYNTHAHTHAPAGTSTRARKGGSTKSGGCCGCHSMRSTPCSTHPSSAACRPRPCIAGAEQPPHTHGQQHVGHHPCTVELTTKAATGVAVWRLCRSLRHSPCPLPYARMPDKSGRARSPTLASPLQRHPSSAPFRLHRLHVPAAHSKRPPQVVTPHGGAAPGRTHSGDSSTSAASIASSRARRSHLLQNVNCTQRTQVT